MKRSELLAGTAALGIFYAAGLQRSAGAPSKPVNVGFLLSEGAVMIDFAGPWEVFQDVSPPGRTAAAFNLYTVAETKQPITLSAGAKMIPNYDFGDVPAPGIVVVPAQSPPTQATLQWLRATAKRADVVMSVCTGAFVLAKAGLLDGLTVTTHHGSYATLAMEYPAITVKRGARFVDSGRIATAGGLTSGMDLAMHIVARYYGQSVASDTAYYMEYQGQGWRNAASNQLYAKRPTPRAGDALCEVCWMEVDPKTAPSSKYKGKTYYFCMTPHKQAFDAAPERFLSIDSAVSSFGSTRD